MSKNEELQQDEIRKEELIEEEEVLTGPVVESDEDFDLESILKEFGDISEEEEDAEPVLEDLTEETPEEEALAEDMPDIDEDAADIDEDIPAATEEVSGEKTAEAPPVTGDTIRLDMLPHHETAPQPEDTPVADSPQILPPVAEPFSQEWEPEYAQPMGVYVPPEPIVFRPKSRIRELKRKLVAGPEKRYYELIEQGRGKLQVGMFLNFLVVLLAIGSTVLYGIDMVQDSRMKLMIFLQVLVMLLAGLLGSSQLVEGAADIPRRGFTLNTMVLVTFLACCADGVFCLLNQKVPCCAAFSLEMLMCQWSAYHKRTTEISQMDTLRKASQLDALVGTPDYYNGKTGLLRRDGQVEDFMDHYQATSGPEKVLNIYALCALVVSIGIGVTAGVLHSVVLGIRAFAAALLAAMPVTVFISQSRPMALLQKRLHALGTVLCGWRGVRQLNNKLAFPLQDADLFPVGSMKMNGVKFYGSRDPDQVVSYATALINADGNGLAPLFNQLLESRNGYHYDVQNLRSYPNGGLGAEICGDPVLVGILPFLQEMGVDMPEGTRVNQAVYIAIDGQLSGVFAITYSRMKSATTGMATLCSYRKIQPVLVSGNFMLTEGFLRSKFGVRTKRIAFPTREAQSKLEEKTPEESMPTLALTTRDGLASAAFAVTGAQALRKAAVAGAVVHMIGGILGLAMMMILAILGEETLLTPMNLLLFELIWIVPGFLLSEWTRSV